MCYMELTRMSWNPNMHIISEAVRSSMKSSGLSISLRSLAYLRTHKFALAINFIRSFIFVLQQKLGTRINSGCLIN